MKSNKIPKARTCYICGKQTLIHGFEFHVAQCRDLFQKRESLKPPKERQRCPVDPMLMNSNVGIGGKPMSALNHLELEELNNLSHKTFVDSLARCNNCGRSFLPEKLKIHLNSCTPNNPARRVDETVNRRTENYENNNYTNYNHKSGSKYDDYDTNSDYVDTGNRMTCKDCGRSFNSNSFSKHAKFCKKVFGQKRKQYDSRKHRIEGTELAAFVKHNKYANSSRSATNGLSSSSSASKSVLPKWKADSISLRKAMQAARMVSVAEKMSKATGIPLHQLLPAATTSRGSGRQSTGRNRSAHVEYDEDYTSFGEIDPSFIRCPNCGRSFNQKAGERHIPQCRSIINKPKRLTKHSGTPSYSTMSSVQDRSFEKGSFGSSHKTAHSSTFDSYNMDDSLKDYGSIGSQKRNDPSTAYKISQTNQSQWSPFDTSTSSRIDMDKGKSSYESKKMTDSTSLNRRPASGLKRVEFNVPDRDVKPIKNDSLERNTSVTQPFRLNNTSSLLDSQYEPPNVGLNRSKYDPSNSLPIQNSAGVGSSSYDRNQGRVRSGHMHRTNLW